MKGTKKWKRKINSYVSTLTEVFLNQKRINVCEHTVKRHTTQAVVCWSSKVVKEGSISVTNYEVIEVMHRCLLDSLPMVRKT